MIGAAAGAVGVADRGRRLQVFNRRAEMAQRGGRLSERQLDRAHVNPGSGAVRDVLAAERLEPSRQELDVLHPAEADGGQQARAPRPP